MIYIIGTSAMVFIILGFIATITNKQKYLIHLTLILVVTAVLAVYWDNLKIDVFVKWFYEKVKRY